MIPSREVAFEAAMAGLRRTLAPLGAAAVEAVNNPACESEVNRYIEAAGELSDAMQGFSGAEDAALRLERAAALYRGALRTLCDRVGNIALESLTTDRPQ